MRCGYPGYLSQSQEIPHNLLAKRNNQQGIPERHAHHGHKKVLETDQPCAPEGKEKWCLTSTETIRLIRDGKGRKGMRRIARPRAPTRKGRRDCRPPSERQCQGGGDPASEKQLVYFANCCLNSCSEQRHKVSVREATVEEQMKQKIV